MQVSLTIPYQVHLKNGHPGTPLGIAIAKVQLAELRKFQNLVCSFGEPLTVYHTGLSQPFANNFRPNDPKNFCSRAL